MPRAQQTDSIARRMPVPEITRKVGIPYSTLRQWIAEGRLPATKAPNGRLYCLVSDVEALFRPIQ